MKNVMMKVRINYDNAGSVSLLKEFIDEVYALDEVIKRSIKIDAASSSFHRTGEGTELQIIFYGNVGNLADLIGKFAKMTLAEEHLGRVTEVTFHNHGTFNELMMSNPYMSSDYMF